MVKSRSNAGDELEESADGDQVLVLEWEMEDWVKEVQYLFLYLDHY